MHLVICYKNFAIHAGISHIGLGVAAINTAKVLRSQNIRVDVYPLSQPNDIFNITKLYPDTTHIVISAPWIETIVLSKFIQQNSEIKLAINCHSNVGFLQADTNAIKLIREYMTLERSSFNFFLAGNSTNYCDWVKTTYQVDCKFLPNLYYIDNLSCTPRPIYNGGTLRIGLFGAVRPLKNMMTGAAAALEIGASLREPLELSISTGRAEGGGEVVLNSIKAMFANLKSAKLVLEPWAVWPDFRRTISMMHLLLQPSYTESFNMVTADGVAEGVPSVVSEAISWAPKSWVASIDDALDVARVGKNLIRDPRAPIDGANALKKYISNGITAWKEFLN